MNHQHHPRRILNPGASRLKRKVWEPIYPAKPTPPVTTTTSSSMPAEPVISVHLLAGYMAHEFLTKGTLLGEKFDPARAKAVPVSSAQSSKWGKYKGKGHNNNKSGEAEPSGKGKLQKNSQSYAEVAVLVKSGGTHIPGIVNPTQLARWIQM